MLSAGAVLNDRYRLEERVATGGMGQVWRATDRTLQRPVAVKVLLPALLSDEEFCARFQAEARMVAALHHPGVVRVYDYGESVSDTGERAMYLVMQYVEGEPLSRRIKETGRLTVSETMALVAKTAQALHSAHLGGIIHRDVKPDNLLVQADGSVVLVDFGVARATATTRLTAANTVLGTALYMAPEQASGGEVTPATDIYALGAVAYHCLAGDPPFTGDKILEVAIRHLQDEPPPLPDDVPTAVAALVFRALAKQPDQRYPSAAAFARAARAAVADPSTLRAGAALPVTGGRGVRAAATAGAGSDSGRGPSTVRDMIAVPVPPARPRRAGRAATVGGAAAAVLLALVGLTAALGFAPSQKDKRPATVVPAESPSATEAPATPSGPPDEAGNDAGPGPTRTAPGSGAGRPSVTAVPSATPSVQPSGTAQPTGTATPSPTPTTTTTPPVVLPTTETPPTDPTTTTPAGQATAPGAQNP